jgi:DNA-binding CsgD family transcriptional regulator/tetratricopeptide (TPR) repeat protein
LLRYIQYVGLIERDDALGRLHELLDEAATGSGRLALVRGEAGIGKTSVVKEFVAALGDAHVLWGGCDDLLAARPLGPIWDMAFDEPILETALHSDDRQDTLRAVFELLTRTLRPTVMVIEDVHWADDATLDLLKFVGRRIDRTHGLVIITYRDGETPGDHPLRVALGDLPHGVVDRIELEPLSPDGVKEMAGQDIDTQSLWELTGGNPFFVSEAVATASDHVPVSISDAVNARVRRLSDGARRLVELASVAPSRAEIDVVTAILGDSSEAIAECEKAGILEVTGDSLRFRHELARRAVEDDLPEITRRHLNLDTLNACEGLGYDVSRCAHHAREAEDAEAMLRILPGAARRASELESHAEALATLRALRPYLDMMTSEQLADHYDLWAYEEYLGADVDMELIDKAIEIRRELGDPAALGNSLLIASRLAWVGTNRALAMQYAEEAAEVVGDLGGEDLARSYSVLSQLAMLGGFVDESIAWGEKALALLGDEDNAIRAHALNNLGTTKLGANIEGGLEELLESRRISAKLGLLHDETRACVNLAWNYLTEMDLDNGIFWIEEGLKVTEDAEMPSFESYAYAEKAWWHEMRGEWDQAEEMCNSSLEMSGSLKTSQSHCSSLLARLAVRRGSPRTSDLLADAVERAEFADEAQRLGPAYVAVAESRWLGGEVSSEEIGRTLDIMQWCFDHRSQWQASEIAQWLYLSGDLQAVPEGMREPHRLLCQGKWEQAAAWWLEHGLPYERAVALSFGDVDARLQALGILDGLGAVPLAARIRSELQSEGVKGVPRGPQKSTRQHDLGLTARQAEVLALLGEELTNSQIADRLFLSTRTVDHHVSAILSRLGADSREEAVRIAADRGILV